MKVHGHLIWNQRLQSVHGTVSVGHQKHLRNVLAQTDFWKNLDVCCQIIESVLEVLLISDGNNQPECWFVKTLELSCVL